jgi:crotonobetainyl-CoA:carnitine CoA-transferase CaiB-like acyl-CoA transferase
MIATRASSPHLQTHLPLPLEGVRVLDFGTAWAGPHASEVLAWLGADVVKVESARRLDLFRQTGGLETTPGFNEINLNKRSLSLDLRQPKAVDLAHRLVRVADVLVDNFRPGVMDRLGLSYETVHALNPRAIMASISAFGQTGDESGYAGYAAIFCAMGGLADVTGYPDWEPALVRSPMDLTVANAAAGLILAALHSREETGRGRFLDVSATEVVATLTPLALMRAARNQEPALRRGNDGHTGFQGCYRSLGDDRWIAIAVECDDGARALGEAIRLDLEDGAVPEASRRVLDDACRTGSFASLASMQERPAAARAAIQAWTEWQDAWLVAEYLAARGVAAHPTSSPESEANEGHLWGRGALATVDHAVQGELVVLHAPWRAMDGATGGRPGLQPGPLFGEHTRDVLVEWLDMDDDEYATLHSDGVFA